jgi:hypothetical protein
VDATLAGAEQELDEYTVSTKSGGEAERSKLLVCGEEVLRWVDVFWLMLEVAFGDEGQALGFCRPGAWPTDKKSRPESQPKFPHTRPHSQLHVPRPPGSGPGSVLRRPFGIDSGPLREWPLSGARDLSRLCSRGSRPREECIQHLHLASLVEVASCALGA